MGKLLISLIIFLSIIIVMNPSEEVDSQQISHSLHVDIKAHRKINKKSINSVLSAAATVFFGVFSTWNSKHVEPRETHAIALIA